MILKLAFLTPLHHLWLDPQGLRGASELPPVTAACSAGWCEGWGEGRGPNLVVGGATTAPGHSLWLLTRGFLFLPLPLAPHGGKLLKGISHRTSSRVTPEVPGSRLSSLFPR